MGKHEHCIAMTDASLRSSVQEYVAVTAQNTRCPIHHIPDVDSDSLGMFVRYSLRHRKSDSWRNDDSPGATFPNQVERFVYFIQFHAVSDDVLDLKYGRQFRVSRDVQMRLESSTLRSFNGLPFSVEHMPSG
jgi:calcineurin-like phosphoesterase family protein